MAEPHTPIKVWSLMNPSRQTRSGRLESDWALRSIDFRNSDARIRRRKMPDSVTHSKKTTKYRRKDWQSIYLCWVWVWSMKTNKDSSSSGPKCSQFPFLDADEDGLVQTFSPLRAIFLRFGRGHALVRTTQVPKAGWFGRIRMPKKWIFKKR